MIQKRDIVALFVLCSVLVTPISAMAQQAATNHDAIRQMFPAIRLFDKKQVAVPTAASSPASSPATASQMAGTSPAASTRFDTFDVAGLRIGMPFAEAEATLVRRGYTPQNVPFYNNTYNFAGKVAEAHHNLDPRYVAPRPVSVIKERGYQGPGGQSIYVTYIPGPTATVVSRVDYRVQPSIIAPATLKATAISKYGAPDSDHEGGYSQTLWCEERCQGSEPQHGRRIVYFEGTLALRDGGDLETRINRQISDEAARLAGRGTAPAI